MRNTTLMNLINSNPFPSFFDNYSNEWSSPQLNHLFNEDEKNYYSSVDMPGMKPEDISIETKNGTLSVKAERECSSGGTKTKKSYSFTSNIPADVNADAIKVHYENGVLDFVMPKKESSIEQGKKLQISTGKKGQEFLENKKSSPKQ